MKEIRTRKVDRHKHRAFLSKAEAFFNTMKRAESEGDWNSAGLLAVHLAISFCDAVTVFFLQEHSTSDRHEDVVEVLGRTGIAGVREKTRQVLDVLSEKTLIAYEPDEPSEARSRNIVKQAERIYKWSKDVLPKQ